MPRLHAFIIAFALTAICLTTMAQVRAPKDISNEAVSERIADSISRAAFAKMITGTEDIISSANYAAFTPTDGKFTLAANVFFSIKHKADTSKKGQSKRRAEHFAIGFTGSGAIEGGTVATLFDGAKLNTGTNLGIKLSWRLNRPNLGSVNADNQVMIDKREALYIERERKVDSSMNVIDRYADKIQQLELAQAELKRKTGKIISDTAAVRGLLRGAVNDSLKLKYADSLQTLKDKIVANNKKIALMQRDTALLHELDDVAAIDKNSQLDARTPRQQYLSEKYGLSRKGISFKDTVANKIRWEYQKKIEGVELALPVSGMRINWLSLIGNWSRRIYRTYDATLQYADAIQKHDFDDGYTAGLQFNFYSFYKPVHRASLLNFALLVKKTNNLDDLSTTKLTDETTITNGNTIRKSSTEYNVYTDAVEEYTTWQLPVNYYRFFGKSLEYGWHVYGQADWRSTHKQVYDVGAGFIFGVNSAGAKRLFNIELYTTYKDLQRSLVDDKTQSKWKQLQVGFSVAIPFMLYKN